MIKPLKKKSDKDKITMQELQTNIPRDIGEVPDPVYFYNKFIRKIGDPILTAEEYKLKTKDNEQQKTKE